MTPVVEPDLTVADDSVQVWKLDSGSTPDEPLGASAIHSALVSTQLEQVCVVVKLLALWVESVTLSVYREPLLTTEALILSPGATDSPTTWMALLGYISHQE